jgi:hypothetical protein
MTQGRPRRKLAAAAIAVGLGVLAIAALGLAGLQQPTVRWRQVNEPLGRWSARFPGPIESRLVRQPRTGLSGMEVKANLPEPDRYGIVAVPLFLDDESLADAAQATESGLQGAGWARRLSIPVTFAGERALRIETAKGDLTATTILVEHRDMRIVVTAAGEHASTFLESFRWTDANEQAGGLALGPSSR